MAATPLTPITPVTPAIKSVEQFESDENDGPTQPAPASPALLPRTEPVLALKVARSGLLFATITATSITVWQTKVGMHINSSFARQLDYGG
jgi:RAB6A-GEF complex partner protein 1